MEVKIKTAEGAILPMYKTDGAAGADLCANYKEAQTIKPLETLLVPTGLYPEIPFGYEGQIRPRSGLASKEQITVLNSPGTIDSDYRGEIKVLLINLSHTDRTIEPGERIAQIVFAKVEQATFQKVDILSVTKRNENGFGSTGLRVE